MSISLVKMAKEYQGDDKEDQLLVMNNFDGYIRTFSEKDLKYGHDEVMKAHSPISEKYKRDYAEWEKLKLSKSTQVVPNNIKLESAFALLKHIQGTDATSLPRRIYRRAAAAQSGTAKWFIKELDDEEQKDLIQRAMREKEEVNKEDSRLNKEEKMTYLPVEE
ncbi:Oidioi.mRNA.OKI2018_I69.YSR.g17199.t1.cds [Oikopleura dioica]|uniref:Oidioi.mRNA.OKI2018_I69.YSR.g17199.t1.cds n=1 Tax=Oikopleura dioica TaxID=34765 RepID=A0ABN7SIF4_OIKDI|nr:Oidioi.mRNA.OKI2018_I69.YSR.g17199.t1.cds [Oikopleura dioica]